MHILPCLPLGPKPTTILMLVLGLKECQVECATMWVKSHLAINIKTNWEILWYSQNICTLVILTAIIPWEKLAQKLQTVGFKVQIF